MNLYLLFGIVWLDRNRKFQFGRKPNRPDLLLNSVNCVTFLFQSANNEFEEKPMPIQYLSNASDIPA